MTLFPYTTLFRSLTRNGSACVVVMDSAAFDAAMAFRNEIYEQEMRTYRGMLKDIQEMQEGKLHDAQDVMDELRVLRGWECSTSSTSA